jgi:hypothetical protein
MTEDPEDPIDLTVAIEFLRGHLSGLLRFDGDMRPVKIIVDREGRLFAPVMVAMIRSVDTVMCVPDDGDEAMQMQVTLEEVAEDGPHAALCDRWKAYHGDPPDVRWARMSIDAARWDGLFIDGDALMVPNALADAEPGILREINRGPVACRQAACRRHGGHEIEKPVVVGVDPGGFDVRGLFGTVRVPADTQIRDLSSAVAALETAAAG